jgi:hypothetical protein
MAVSMRSCTTASPLRWTRMVRRGNERPDGSLWRPWLRIDRVLRVMLHTRWSVEAWSVVRVEFRKAIALRTEIGAWGGSTSR